MHAYGGEKTQGTLRLQRRPMVTPKGLLTSTAYTLEVPTLFGIMSKMLEIYKKYHSCKYLFAKIWLLLRLISRREGISSLL